MTQVIISTGDKGGAGKSTSARQIGEVLLSEGKKVQFIDCDPANPDTLAAFLGRTKSAPLAIDVRNANSVDGLLTMIHAADKETVFIMDMPAGAGEYLAKEAEAFGFLFDPENEITLDVIWTLNTQETGVSRLTDLSDAFEEVPARYTVVKNLFYASNSDKSDPFEIWHKSDIRKELQDAGKLVEATIPEIRQKVIDEIGNQSYADIISGKVKAGFSTKVRCAQIMKDLKENFGHLI